MIKLLAEKIHADLLREAQLQRQWTRIRTNCASSRIDILSDIGDVLISVGEKLKKRNLAPDIVPNS